MNCLEPFLCPKLTYVTDLKSHNVYDQTAVTNSCLPPPSPKPLVSLAAPFSHGIRLGKASAQNAVSLVGWSSV